MLIYKGYVGYVEFDDENDIFHGEVINTRDVITFQGNTTTQLKKAFRDSIDDYLNFCKERNEEPDKPFSGKFNLRIDPALHREISIDAKRHHISLNQWVTEAIKQHVNQQG